ncbi:MAG: FAD-dependent monooxygenase [Rubrobacteraceae bacterium]
MKALVVGAGIGGLTAAIALQRAGIEAVVLERATELREVGAGLLLGANAIKALDKIQLGDAVRGIGASTVVGTLRSWNGEVLVSLSADRVTELVGAGSFAVHRAELQAELLRELGEENVRLGAGCTGFAQDQDGVKVSLDDGDELNADFLIGADGIHSTIRNQLLGDEKPVYAGYTAWRGVAEYQNDLLTGGGGFESWWRGTRFGCARMGNGSMYWFATRNAPERGDDGPTGSRRTLLEMFSGWHDPIKDLIEATGESDIRRDDVYDRDPVKRWGEGRVTLLGDAAHPMTPNLGQGACQAIEDAVVLADCLRGKTGIAAALESYEARRTVRTSVIVRLSRRMGRVGQLEHPLLCRVRDTAVKRMPDSIQRRQLRMVLGYDT